MTVAAIGATGAIVAGGTIPALGATTSGVRYEVVQGKTVGGPNGTGCNVTVLSAAVSAGNPAYVSAMVTNTLRLACWSWLQSSVNGGAWKDVSPMQRLPRGNGLRKEAWYKTANYYAGPGTSIRACVQVRTRLPGGPSCSGPVSLASSTATPASDATSVYWARRLFASISVHYGHCGVSLSSSTRSKASTSDVSLTLLGGDLPQRCTGWLESSTNQGKTWERATSTYSLLPLISGAEYAFSSAVADGTGNLVRACVKGNAAKKCTAAW